MAAPAQAQEARTATLAELIGATPQNLRERLSGVVGEAPVIPGLVIWTPAGVLSFVTVGELVGCNVGMPEEPPPRFPETNAGRTLLMFSDGTLIGALRDPPPLQRVEAPEGLSPRDRRRYLWDARQRRPVESAFIPYPGALPLEDGAGFIQRRGALPLDTAFTATCEQPVSRPPQEVCDTSTTERGHQMSAHDVIWNLAVLPRALMTLGPLNRDRVRAQREGQALLASLAPGEELGESPEDFARSQRGVRVYRGQAADYVVLSIDIGDEPSNNLSRRNNAAFTGVRGGRIEWISPGMRFLGRHISSGLPDHLMCLDESNVRGEVRAGCDESGNFQP